MDRSCRRVRFACPRQIVGANLLLDLVQGGDRVERLIRVGGLDVSGVVDFSARMRPALRVSARLGMAGGACIGAGAGEGSGALRTMALLTAPRSINVDAGAGVGVGTATPS